MHVQKHYCRVPYLVAFLLVKLDGGEAVNLGVLELVGRGVHLDDEHVIAVLVLLGQLVVDGRQLLAVAAPGGVELNQNILGLVKDDLIEVLLHHHLDGVLVPVIRQLLGQQALLDGAVEHTLDEGLDILGLERVRLWLEAGHVALELDEPQGGNLVLLEAKELEDALVVLIINVDCHEENLQ